MSLGAIISATVEACHPQPVPTSRTVCPVSSSRASFIIETMSRQADLKGQLSGAETVCPEPIGSGESIAAYALSFSEMKRHLGTISIALMTCGVLSMPLLMRSCMRFSH